MNRRAYLRTLAAIGIPALAGCLTESSNTGVSDPDVMTPSETGGTPTSRTLPTLDLTTEPTTVEASEAEDAFQIEWRSRVQSRVAPVDEERYTYAEEGNKWVVIQCRATCERGPATLSPIYFELETPTKSNEPVVSREGDYPLTESELAEGETLSRYLLFHVPRGARQGTLSVIQSNSRETLSVSWSENTELLFGAKR